MCKPSSTHSCVSYVPFQRKKVGDVNANPSQGTRLVICPIAGLDINYLLKLPSRAGAQ